MSYNTDDELRLQSFLAQTHFEGNSKTPTPLETTPTASIPPQPLYHEILPPQNRVECKPLEPGYAIEDLMILLPPDISSQPDPLGHLIHQMMQRSNSNISSERVVLNNLLQTKRLPRCYIPYARALSSLFQCWPDVYKVKLYIRRVLHWLPPNDANFSFLPADISLSPQLLKLFTGDIFTDPIPPSRILRKLSDMPKNDILNLEAELQKFHERLVKELANIPFRERQYLWYAEAVLKLLQKHSAFDDLKRDIAAVQPTNVATSN